MTWVRPSWQPTWDHVHQRASSQPPSSDMPNSNSHIHYYTIVCIPLNQHKPLRLRQAVKQVKMVKQKQFALIGWRPYTCVENACGHSRNNYEYYWYEFEKGRKNTTGFGMCQIFGCKCSLYNHLITAPVPHGIYKYAECHAFKKIRKKFNLKPWMIVLHNLER